MQKDTNCKVWLLVLCHDCVTKNTQPGCGYGFFYGGFLSIIMYFASEYGIMSDFAPNISTLNLKHRKAAISDALQSLNNPTLAQVLANRGVQSIDELDLDVGSLLPAAQLLGLDAAVLAIDTAIDCKHKIVVVGDFDCDGATSTALVVRVLQQMGADVRFVVPDRFRFGYGLTPKLAVHVHNLHTPQLIITVDNGISSHEGVEQAKSLGMSVVITDHHLTSEPTPDAVAVVNPNQLGCTFASKSLVGVGVAFYVMGALAKKRRQENKSTAQVSRYLDLVALGTVADVGVLDKNNRILVAHGLQLIRQGKCCVGILAILYRAKVDFARVTTQDLGFAIAPRINAAGRMDNMQIGIECLLCDDTYTADTLAGQLSQLNEERRQVEGKMREMANQMLDGLDFANLTQKAVILYDDSWHQGVIGIVAGRIKEKLYVPTLIFAPSDPNKTGADDFIKASARSILGVHIRDTILKIAERYPDLIVQFGGHAMAAGLTLYRRDFARFCDAFYEAMGEFDESVFLEQKYSDGALLPADLSLAFVSQLQKLTVWGHGFLYPSFDGVFGVQSHRILKEKHLKLVLTMAGVQYPIEAIWFGYDRQKWDYRASAVHILYTLDINEWQGNQSVQLIVQDLAVTQISTNAPPSYR